jgi:hypothetical protein
MQTNGLTESKRVGNTLGNITVNDKRNETKQVSINCTSFEETQYRIVR